MSPAPLSPSKRLYFRLRTFHWASAPDWTGVWPTHACSMRVRGRETPRRTDQYSIHLVLSGVPLFHAEGVPDVSLTASSTFLVEPGRPFQYCGPNGQPVHLLVVRIAGPLAPAYVRSLGYTWAQPSFPAADARRAARTLRGIFRIAGESNGADSAAAVAALYSLIDALRGNPGPEAGPGLADQFTRHLHACLEDGENVDEIARRLGVSRSSLFLHVRERYGSTPSALIIEARLARAQLLLETTDHSGIDVARMSGYRSPEHFHRQFQKYNGLTPQDWRMRKQTEADKLNRIDKANR